jgi:pimeloyl-ACP methyl ester carboxylesterase
MALPLKADEAEAMAWGKGARPKLAALTGYDSARAAALPCPSRIAELDEESVGPGLVKRSFYLRVRPDTDVPVHLIYQPTSQGGKPLPVFLHLAGSTSGVHLGWGAVRVPIDHQRIAIGADMARQAAARGYLAVAIEQIGYGERGERDLAKASPNRTIDAANHLLLIGRTLMGDGAADVSGVVDFLLAGGAGVPVDPERLFLFGHSAGGTLAQYAAALDPRVKGVLASGSIGPIRDAIAGRGAGGGDGIVPGLLNWFDSADLIALVAPRPFVGLSGRADHIYPYDGVDQVVEAARPLYASLNAEQRLAAVPVDGPHRYYAKESWQAFERWIDPQP